ncbi:YajG family lipoprotein [Aporhodopirellula aestuarii]|uniref:Lipoprotein n=1 Tax=Aporhodopirellula aestuarii TaxID=2950107 RepID=A0ABT0U229_9BACT|nr:hypothetical protein [Aporhodopirellula aestuarii]MCM2370957.1 hypothetical protein [Aporhodopirellula aestuarii]
MLYSPILLICFLIVSLGLVGCGSSPTSADLAAEQYLDVVVESRKRMDEFNAQRTNVDGELSEAEQARIPEIVSPIRSAYSKFSTEVAKLSAAEREAFKKKWQPRFDAVEVSMR